MNVTAALGVWMPLLRKIRSVVSSSVLIAVASQSLLSMLNFATALFIARQTSKSEYGTYIIYVTIVELAGNYQAALITTPMMVLAQGKREVVERQRFMAGLAVAQCCLLAVLLIALGICTGFYVLVRADQRLLLHVGVVALATTAYLIWEYARSVRYATMQINALLAIDAVFAVTVVAALAGLALGGMVSSVTSVLAFVAGYCVSIVFAAVIWRQRERSSFADALSSLREAWQHSRWGMLGISLEMVKNQGYVYATTAFLGLGTLADISVARLFVRPIGLFVTSCGRITLAKGANILATHGMRHLKEFVRTLSLLLLVLWAGYCIVMYFAYGTIVAIFGSQYGGVGKYVAVWCLFMLVYLLRYTHTNALITMTKFKAMAKIGFVSSVATLLSTVFLVLALKGVGAITALVFGEMIMLVLALVILTRSTQAGAPSERD